MTRDFTTRQRRAVESRAPVIMCLAGPGSGKTTVLAERIRRILSEGENLNAIAAFTYTNAAARNLEQRLDGSAYQSKERVELGDHEMITDTVSLGGFPVRLGYAGTLHGFCLRMLRAHGGAWGYGERTAVLDEASSADLLRDKAEQMGSKSPLSRLLRLKAAGRPRKSTGEPYSKDQLVILAYCEEMREAGLVDFDLILTEFLRLLRDDPVMGAAVRGRFSHVLVDETQDQAAVDWEIVDALPVANKFLVGDPDQAIYGFRGASSIVLSENFRCSQAVCVAANRLIAKNNDRLPKLTLPIEGAPVGVVYAVGPFPNEGTEIAQILLGVQELVRDEMGTVAVLCRSNKVAEPIAKALAVVGACVEVGQTEDLPPDWHLARALVDFLARPQSDTLAFFYWCAREVAKGADPVAARREATQLRRLAAAKGYTFNQCHVGVPVLENGVGLAAANLLGVWLDKEGLTREASALVAQRFRDLGPGATLAELGLDLARARPPAPPPSEQVGVFVGSIHAAKGREWDHVFVAGFEDELCPGHAKSADVEEERRVAFVAVTRARRSVVFSSSALRTASWGYKPVEKRTPSRFIGEALP